MKKLFVTVFLSSIAFSPVISTAQKNKPVDSKPLATKSVATQPDKKSVAVQSDKKSVVEKTPFQKSDEVRKTSVLEIAVLEEINVARTDPQKYIQYLEDYKKLFKGNTVTLSKELYLNTKEGIVPVDEAINHLKSIPTLTPFSFSNGLNKIVGLHMVDLMENSALSHKGKDGSDLITRLNRSGTVGDHYAENISFYVETARNIVMNMLIDDGFKSRSHRMNVLSPNFKLIGVAFGKGKAGEGLCIVDFADTFNEGVLPKNSNEKVLPKSSNEF